MDRVATSRLVDLIDITTEDDVLEGQRDRRHRPLRRNVQLTRTCRPSSIGCRELQSRAARDRDTRVPTGTGRKPTHTAPEA